MDNEVLLELQELPEPILTFPLRILHSTKRLQI